MGRRFLFCRTCVWPSWLWRCLSAPLPLPIHSFLPERVPDLARNGNGECKARGGGRRRRRQDVPPVRLRSPEQRGGALRGVCACREMSRRRRPSLAPRHTTRPALTPLASPTRPTPSPRNTCASALGAPLGRPWHSRSFRYRPCLTTTRPMCAWRTRPSRFRFGTRLVRLATLA